MEEMRKDSSTEYIIQPTYESKQKPNNEQKNRFISNILYVFLDS